MPDPNSEQIFVNLNMPSSWADLSDRHLWFVFSLIASEYSADEIKLLALLKFSGLSPVGKMPAVSATNKGKFIFRIKKDLISLSYIQIAEALQSLDFLLQVPDIPVPLSRCFGRRHVDILLQGVSFDSYLILENLYQGYLTTNDESLLRQITDILYPKQRLLKWLPYRLMMRIAGKERAFLISALYWLISLKAFFARRFHDFFQPVDSDDSGNLLGGPASLSDRLQECVNAQIRALTKGDITKEDEILSLDTWRALTELNAQAREYANLNAQIKKS